MMKYVALTEIGHYNGRQINAIMIISTRLPNGKEKIDHIHSQNWRQIHLNRSTDRVKWYLKDLLKLIHLNYQIYPLKSYRSASAKIMSISTDQQIPPLPPPPRCSRRDWPHRRWAPGNQVHLGIPCWSSSIKQITYYLWLIRIIIPYL